MEIGLNNTFEAFESFLEDMLCGFDPESGNSRQEYDKDHDLRSYRSFSRSIIQNPRVQKDPTIKYLSFLEKLGIET